MARLRSGDCSCKRRRGPQDPDVDETTLKRFKPCRDNNVSLFGPLVRDKASFLAQSLGHPDIRASVGWLDNWKNDLELLSIKLLERARQQTQTLVMIVYKGC
ncbi:hypothetical protein QAD02_019728 [Eretmocerus hayati]|uniref:Uncharacterized protein n=1 Tax=Eretmocerus hayati TaxID=131215 RepID=A0ACC2PM94_9HYME|nr:hypothetical protein QAD02_019728 [Eretmocerus hayati]